jgi:hypothetical protein
LANINFRLAWRSDPGREMLLAGAVLTIVVAVLSIGAASFAILMIRSIQDRQVRKLQLVIGA